ncbi:MAG: hypothetical protein NXI32_18100 [bacterium]|nr:hypothetical protein [bacterium]
MSAAIGFLIVRSLSKEDYAQFNLLTVSAATFGTWSSIGIVSIFIPFARYLEQKGRTIDQIAFAFGRLDRRIVGVAMIASTTVLVVSSIRQGWLSVSFCVAATFFLLSAGLQYRFRLTEVALRTFGKPVVSFAISLKSEFVRCCLVLFAIGCAMPIASNWVTPLLGISAFAASSLALWEIRQRFASSVGAPYSETASDKETYNRLLSPLLFPSYFYHVSQFFRSSIVFLICGTSVIAEAAALGRLMMLFSMMDRVVEAVVLPRFGKSDSHADFLDLLVKSSCAVLCVTSCIFLSAMFFPGIWLWILGDKYSTVTSPLLWATAAACVERLSGLFLFSQLAYGQTRNQWWVPLISTGAYLAWAFFIGLDSTESVTKALFFSAAVNLVAQFLILTARIWSWKKAAAN